MEIFYGLIYLIGIILVLTILTLVISSLPLVIRGYLIKKFACKYGLNFDRNFKFKFFVPRSEKINICTGKINNTDIIFFDYIDYKGVHTPFTTSPLNYQGPNPMNNNGYMSDKSTIFIIENKKYIVNNFLFSGYASLYKIAKILASIEDKKINIKYLKPVEEYKIKIHPLYLILVIIIFLIVWFKFRSI